MNYDIILKTCILILIVIHTTIPINIFKHNINEL